MNIENVNLALDFFDVEVLENYEKNLQITQNSLEELKKKKSKLSSSQILRKHCEILKKFIDGMYGDGTSIKLFGERNNLKEITKIYFLILEEGNKAKDEMHDITSNKYLPIGE